MIPLGRIGISYGAALSVLCGSGELLDIWGNLYELMVCVVHTLLKNLCNIMQYT